MPNNVVLPAPFGPMTPTNSPSCTDIERLGITTMSLYRLPIACSSRIIAVSSGELEQLELPLYGYFRRNLVVGDEELRFAVCPDVPLAADDPHLRDVLHAAATEVQASDNSVRLEGAQGLCDLLGRLGIRARLQR